MDDRGYLLIVKVRLHQGELGGDHGDDCRAQEARDSL